jgi:hypothetical protein
VEEQPKRMKLSVAQVALIRELLDGKPPSLLRLAEQVGRGEVLSDPEADELVDALSDVMLNDEYDDLTGLTARGMAIEDVLGIVQQMSEGFYR